MNLFEEPPGASLFRTLRFLLILILPVVSQAQTFVGASSSPADGGTQTGTTATITPPGAMAAGDLVVVYAHYRNTTGTISISTTGGQSWYEETQPAAANSQTFAIFWCRYNGTWSANPEITGSGSTGAPLTATMYVYRPTAGTAGWTVHRGAVNSNPAAATNVTVTAGFNTTIPNTVTMAFWGVSNDNTWGSLNGTGWSKTGYSAQYRNLGGSDQAHSAAYFISAATASVPNVRQTQNSSLASRTSIISWGQVAVPSNDLCSAPTPLTSSTSCTNTAGTLTGATYTDIPTIDCGVSERSDVWYSFTAQSPNPTITLSAAPAGASLQLFSGTCGALVSESCGTNTLTASGLTIGATYRVRVYSDPNELGTFNICVQDPVPANDLCANAIVLTAFGSCSPTSGTLLNASYTNIPAIGCGVASRNDVWYRFTATSTTPTITLSTAMANARLQLFSGTCGALTSIACGNGSIAATGLTVGNTYYVRVYSDPNASGTFDICITDPPTANDLCANAISLTTGATCVNTAGTLVGASYTNIPTIGCGVASANDVWYTFVAQSPNPVITLTTAMANPRIQLFSGSCGALTPVACGNGTLSATGLTSNATYYIRVYTDPNVVGSFNICVTDPVPANDLCGSSTLLTTQSSCAGAVAGTLYSATYTNIPAIGCGVASRNDVWYRFVAQTTNPVISLTTSMANARLQLFSGTCAALTSIACGNGSIEPAGLTVGTTYYVRVYSDPNTLGSFTICVADRAPANDDCTGSVNLAVTSSCSNITSSMLFANPSLVPLGGTCAAATNVADVWFKFTAVNNTASIQLNNIGSGIGTPRIEVLSGDCNGVLTTVACGAQPLLMSGTLTPGQTYLVRVYASSGSIPATNANFDICVTSSLLPTVKFGNSYVNLSKKTTGGVVEKGDTLEIRMTINHTSGTMYYLRYVDNVPNHTAMLAGANDSIRVITNEGLTFRKYTPAAGDDAAVYKASPLPGEYNIKMNLGFGSFAPGNAADNLATSVTGATGRMTANTDRPRGGGGMLFATAYRVVVTGDPGDTISINPGQFLYKTTNSAVAADVTLTATPFKLLINDPLSLCANSTGINNAAELGGTFGSGNTLNRTTDLSVPIPGYNFVNNISSTIGLNDGRYAIVKNISPRNSTNRTANHVPNCGSLPANDPNNCNNRMHGGHWDIDGDHTGTSTSTGNTPPGDGVNGGYMLMVNADFVASQVFTQTLNNLCPNTYYEFSAWFRNICSTCGMDSTGAQFAGTVTAPAAGYVGVYPNLSFSLDGLDYYSTGEIPLGGWLKKGFVFRTEAGQTSATFSIRNNSQGGGGNDWVMDDIAVATCLPSMSYSPSLTPTICEGNSLLIRDTIRSYFDNYTHFKWQRSIDGGANYTDVTTAQSVVLGAPVGGLYEYITQYHVPPTTLSDSGHLYRVIVSTAAQNLGNADCQVTDGVSIITLDVIDCTPVLATDILSFNGKLVDAKGVLNWSTSKEDGPFVYILEKSEDGSNFTTLAEIPGYNNGSSTNHYSFTDPSFVKEKSWYRIIMKTPTGKKKHSSIIQLRNDVIDFELSNLVNPFNSTLAFNLTNRTSSMVTIELIDMSGKTIYSANRMVYAGTNSINAGNMQSLAAGIYTLRVASKDRFITRRVVKNN